MPELEPTFELMPKEESEKETRGIAIACEISLLRARAKTDEDYQQILQKTLELKKRMQDALQGGGTKAIEKQAAMGKKTARERVLSIF